MRLAIDLSLSRVETKYSLSADEVTALYLRPSEAELKRAAAAGLGAAHA